MTSDLKPHCQQLSSYSHHFLFFHQHFHLNTPAGDFRPKTALLTTNHPTHTTHCCPSYLHHPLVRTHCSLTQHLCLNTPAGDFRPRTALPTTNHPTYTTHCSLTQHPRLITPAGDDEPEPSLLISHESAYTTFLPRSTPTSSPAGDFRPTIALPTTNHPTHTTLCSLTQHPHLITPAGDFRPKTALLTTNHPTHTTHGCPNYLHHPLFSHAAPAPHHACW
jgi:hypothetical protein